MPPISPNSAGLQTCGYAANLKVCTTSLLKTHNIRPQKRLGQNFLTSDIALQNILKTLDIKTSDIVLEIGTGLGTVTAEIVKLAKQVITVEVDKKILAVARDHLKEFNNITFIEQSFLEVDLSTYLPNHLSTYKVFGNLPYYITTPIIEKLLTTHDLQLTTIVLTVQKEFAQRIVAKPGTKNYSSFSIFVQFYAQPKIICKIPASSFYPKPSVDSALLRLTPNYQLPITNQVPFFAIVRAAFSQRRKTLRNAILSAKIISPEKLDQALKAAKIDGTRRGETLFLEEFLALNDKIAKL